MRRTSVVLAVAVVLSSLALPAEAITDGTRDHHRHPYVGLMVAQDRDGDPLWRCSGTLLSRRMFLTAGHCTARPAARAEIWFEANVRAGIPQNRYPNHGDVGGKPYTHPRYDRDAFYLHDLGVVLLDRAVAMPKYGALPRLNALDALQPSRGTIFTAVGYGAQKAFPDATAWKDETSLVRMLARPHLVQINTGFTGDGSLVLSNNASTGGTCFGDSGGPNFVDHTNVIAGVTSFALNGTCGGAGGVYRVDRADDLDWLARFRRRHLAR